ncbi:carboxylesterase/lipase family protein [Methylocella tundrae]|uniref:Carboxylic ester hydrolase n=1 Tax=Methylocella tundrae TaxID=227605 RepID=A0A4U8YVH2_METTU|nr:carboxylesterase family protein [Methylocella tundrae]WPP05018.1 carboxylesterase family protein [Methylocella tundrae]VFU07313.1 Carboxylic ester hydrolase [Methylocella tundrae]
MALGLVVAAGALMAPMQADAKNPLRVDTKEGPVRGFLKNGIAEFLGIPYAEPPVGDLRWMPPKKHAHWSNVLKATAFGPQCAQIVTLGLFAGPPNNNEDCLYLNVYSPNVDPAAREKLPVIVWIHGGGNVDGASDGYDGSKLAADGHTVVVTINYRLSLLGWIAHPALDAEGHPFGNYGLLDQQMALKWVRRNIAEFGGDKNNVTLGGQSAGSLDTQANMVSPLAAGLFHRAIWESGVQEPAPLAFAEAHGTAFAVAAGCGSGADAATAKCLRSLTAAQIMNLSVSGPYSTTNGVIADGQILPANGIRAAFKNGQFNHVPVISGSTHDEGNFGLAITEYGENPRVPFTEADFVNLVKSTYTGNSGPAGSPPPYPVGVVDKVLAHYPLYAYPTPQLAMDAVSTQGSVFFPCTTRQILKSIANQVPVYAYEFDDQTAPFYFPKMPGFQPLAYHTSDIQYLFPLWHGGADGIPHPLNKMQQALSDQLVTAWTNFAWTGNPNGQGNSPWPRYRLQPNKAYYLSENIPVLSTMSDAEYAAANKCDFWDTILK